MSCYTLTEQTIHDIPLRNFFRVPDHSTPLYSDYANSFERELELVETTCYEAIYYLISRNEREVPEFFGLPDEVFNKLNHNFPDYVSIPQVDSLVLRIRNQHLIVFANNYLEAINNATEISCVVFALEGLKTIAVTDINLYYTLLSREAENLKRHSPHRKLPNYSLPISNKSPVRNNQIGNTGSVNPDNSKDELIKNN